MAWSHPYVHLQDPLRRSPFEGTWEKAQLYCNFPVLRPATLPADAKEPQILVRPEGCGGQGWSSLHVTWPGNGRQLRMKQFLWDWSAPYSDPNLVEPPDDCALLSGGDVAWLGVDYKRNRAACMGRYRTHAELSVKAGTYTSKELLDLLDSLAPVDSDILPHLLRAPTHEISYSVRHRQSHWGWEGFTRLNWYAPDAELPGPIRSILAAMRPGGITDQFTLESCGDLIRPDGTSDVQFIWRNHAQGTDQLWFRVIDTASPLSPKPGDEYRFRFSRTEFVRDVPVWYGTMGGYGNRRAIWTVGGRSHDVWQRASPRVTEDAFLRLIDALV